MNGARTTYVLDDEAAVGAIVCRVLNSCGHLASAFDEPSSFISKVQAEPPDLIVLDLALGRSDAIEVIRQLETVNYKGDVILMSGRYTKMLAEISKIGVLRGLSMLPPLYKPFKPTDLKARLEVPQEKATVEVKTQTSGPESKVDLVEAMENRWLQLWYQPKIDLNTLSVCGAEALLRIKHPELGIVMPRQFLPEAGSPLYQPLSSFVILSATSDWKTMAAQNVKTKIAVNMPASVVLDPGFVATVREHLPTDAGFPGLSIEVTEEEIIQDVKTFREVAFQLKLLSVGLSIDDFGTAYSSLSRLKDLPFTELKLDSCFVLNCASDEDKRNICQTVVDLAKRFDVTTCAEGVETAEDLKVLTSMGFDTAQGYLFAKAMPLESLSALLLGEALHSLKNELSGDSSINDDGLQLKSALAKYSGAMTRAGKPGQPPFGGPG